MHVYIYGRRRRRRRRGGGGSIQSKKAMNEVDAGRDPATPASVRHDDDYNEEGILQSKSDDDDEEELQQQPVHGAASGKHALGVFDDGAGARCVCVWWISRLLRGRYINTHTHAHTHTLKALMLNKETKIETKL